MSDPLKPASATAGSLALDNSARAKITEGRIATNGIELNVKNFGDPADTAVVLMHGWMGTSHSWRKLAPLLAEERFVIVPDMRGHGTSDKPEAGYDAVGLAAGLWFGEILSKYISARLFDQLIVAFLVVLAIKLGWSAFF